MEVDIRVASGKELEDAVPALAALMREAIELGAGLGYAELPSQDEAERAWRGWVAEGAAGARVILLARLGNEIVGTVQLDLAKVPNAAHRAEVGKLIVGKAHRGRQLGTRLMRACLAEARRLGRTTIWLNTVDAQAERLYARLGFTRSGEIPLWSQVPTGVWRTSSFWYTHL